MKCITKLYCIFLFTTLMAGCATTPDIIVQDFNGKPIKDAIVFGTSLSISGQKTQSDKNGFADIPWAIQKTEWIAITKPGYISVNGIDVKQNKPIKVILKKK